MKIFNYIGKIPTILALLISGAILVQLFNGGKAALTSPPAAPVNPLSKLASNPSAPLAASSVAASVQEAPEQEPYAQIASSISTLAKEVSRAGERSVSAAVSKAPSVTYSLSGNFDVRTEDGGMIGVLFDRETGCQYLLFNSQVIPRNGRGGKQLCDKNKLPQRTTKN